MDKSTKISVVLISYNGADFIKEQVISILAQLSLQDELLITDDGSTDQTQDIITNIDDPRIRYLDGPRKGINTNVAFGIANAKNDLILLSDQDDLWLPGRVEFFIEKMKSGFGFVFFDAKVIDIKGNVTIPSYFRKHNTKRTFWGNLVKCRTLGCCIGFNKAAFKPQFQLPDNYKKLPFDYYITLYALAFCKVHFSDKPYHLYRRHDKNVSTGGSRSTNSLLQMLQFRWRSLRYLGKIMASELNKGLEK